MEGGENRRVGDKSGVVGQLRSGELLPGSYGTIRGQDGGRRACSREAGTAVSNSEIVDKI